MTITNGREWTYPITGAGFAMMAIRLAEKRTGGRLGSGLVDEGPVERHQLHDCFKASVEYYRIVDQAWRERDRPTVLL